MNGPLVLAVDQGTTNTKAILVDQAGRTCAVAEQRVAVRFPRPGWAESDPAELVRGTLAVITQCLDQAADGSVVAVGVSNQRETVVLWDRATGEPCGPAVSWQCGRGAAWCAAQRTPQLEALVAARTGLVLGPMFSASKIAWLLAHTPGGAARAAAGELCAGTVDAWLVWHLTRGATFATDHTNASRTLLMDLDATRWDDDLLAAFGVPGQALPEIRPSAASYGACALSHRALAAGAPVGGVAGDSHAAFVGQRITDPSIVKATFGTGTSLLAGVDRPTRVDGLSATVAWSRTTPTGPQVTYGLEGNIVATGSGLEWMATLLGLGVDVAALDALARTVDGTAGACFVPALAGLGAPYWDPAARGVLTGLTRATTPAHVARAAFDAVGHQVADVLERLPPSITPARLRADGGAMRSDLLAQTVADLTGLAVERTADPQLAALGAAFLAGMTAGVWSGPDEIAALGAPGDVVHPSAWAAGTAASPVGPVAERRASWRDAVARCRG